MMATAVPQEAICSLVEVGTLELQKKDDSEPFYNGVVVTEDILLVTDFNACNLQLYRRLDGKLMSSHRLESIPWCVCLISKTEVAVCLLNSTIVILSFKSIDDVKLVKTFNVRTGIDVCQSVAKWNSNKLIVIGVKWDADMFYWCVVNLTDGRVDSTHKVCELGLGSSYSHLAIKNDTVYISCQTYDSTVNGVYAYDIFNPHTPKFVYRHDGFSPWSIMVDERNFIYVCGWNSNSIHQLTDSGQLVTIHTVSSTPYGIFYDDQHEVLYTTSYKSNVITVYCILYSHTPDSVIPAEVLKMDTRSLQMYKEALNEGKEKAYNIRVMVVGQYGVGKTTLTQRLLGENVNISERHSTDGIDVHVECCKVSLPAGEWTTQDKNVENYFRLQRLVKLLNEHVQKRGSEGKQNRQVEMVDIVTSEEQDNRHPQYDHLVSAKKDIGQEVKPLPSQPEQSPTARVVPESSSEIVFKENEKDTVMEIIRLVKENSGNLENSMVEYAALALWDFAGQYVFYTTHQTFLTSRAIYLLVIDLSQQLTDLIKDECFLDTEGIRRCKVYEMIEIWLNSIHSCEPSSQPGIPYVILVGTHLDKIPENIRQRVIDKYFMNLRKILKDKPIVLHLMDDFAIDNTYEDPRLEELKQRIFELSKQQPHWGEEKPARWLPLEQALMTLKASGVKVALLSLIEEINRSGSVRIEDRYELDLFLRYQHEMGTILYFSIEGLREKIVLDPQWLIDAQKSLITAETFIRKNPAIIRKWYEFKQSGKLTQELIDAIWSKEKNPEFHDNKHHIILLMEKLNIIARPRTYDQDGVEVKVENYFLAPCMLNDTTPREIIFPKPQPEKKNSSVLCYVFIEQFLPTPIFHRLLAACIAHWPIAKRKNSEFLIFCGCCVFQLDLHHKLTMFFREHVIFVRVTRTGTTGESPSTKLCIEVKDFINITLSSIIGNLEHSLRFEFYIQCPKSEECSVNSLIPVGDLQRNVDVPCHFHDDNHVILSCEVLSFWFQEEGKEDSLQQQQEMEMRELSVSKLDQYEEENTDVQDQILPQVHDVRAKTMTIPSKTCQTKGVPCSDPKLLCQILNRSQQGAYSSQSILEVNCLSVGLELHYETPANGNCFFEAISSQLQRLNCGVQKSPQQLRQEVVAFMRTNRVLHAPEGTIHLDSFIYGETFEDYCTRMTRDGEWADHVVVVAMARKLQIDIMIVTSIPSAGPEDIILWVVGQTAFHGNPILLGHIWESHYVSLQPIAPANLVPVLVGSSTPATTNVPTPAPKSDPTLDTALGSMSSTAVGPSTTRTSITQHMSSYSHKPSPTDAMQTPGLGSTPSTNGELIQAQTSGTTPSTTTGSTTPVVMEAAASNFTTTPVMQSPTYVSTFGVMSAATSASTPSTTDGLMQVQTSVSAPFQTYSSPTVAPSLTISYVMQTPKSESTTANFMQVLTFASTPSSTIVSTTSATVSSTTAAGMQTVTSSSTTTDAMQTPASGSKPSTPADLMLAPVSISTAADLFQAQTSSSEPPTTAGPMPVSTSSSPTAVVMQAPTTISLPSTTTGLMQASASSSTSTDVTQSPAVEDTDRFMHIACLLVNVGSRVLRRLLLYHTVMPGCTLDQYLANNRIDIDDLRKRKILNKSQMDILFPPGGSTSLGDYDITLLSALFTNIVLTISQQELNMIQFLRDKRNEIFAHAKSVAVNSNDYQTFWNDISRTLEALSKQCNDPDFENEILREIQGIQVSTVQGTSFLDTLQTHPRRMETLERLVQALISSQTQESNKASDNNDLSS